MNPGRGSGRRGGGVSGGGGCDCSDDSNFSTRVSSGTHDGGGRVYWIFDGRRRNSLRIAEEREKERLKKRRDTRRQRISRYACVGAHNRVRVRASV